MQARICFSRNLSAFASRFQHSHVRAYFNFFGQEGLRSLKSEGAPTPMASKFRLCSQCSLSGYSDVSKNMFRIGSCLLSKNKLPVGKNKF